MTVIDITRDTFSGKQASDLAGVTRKQLIYWDKRGLVKPSISPATGRGSRRLYSCPDLLALKTVSTL